MQDMVLYVQILVLETELFYNRTSQVDRSRTFQSCLKCFFYTGWYYQFLW